MKEENFMQAKLSVLLKKVLWIALLFIIIPCFFEFYPDYRFFWNVLTLFAICVLLARCIVRKTKICWSQILRLLLSIIMANGWFSYQKIATVFPILNRISESTMIGIGLTLISLTIFSAGIYNMYKTHPVKVLSHDTMKPLDYYPETASESICAGSDIILDYSNVEQQAVFDTQQNNPPQNNPSLKLKNIVGSIIAISAIIALAGVSTYGIIHYKEFFIQLNNDELLTTLFDFVVFLAVVLLAICCLVILVLAFIKTFQQLLRDMILHNGKLNVENDWILGCISILLTILIYIFFKKATLQDLYNIFNGTTEIASLLVGIVTLVILAISYRIIYRLLRSCVKKDGLIHKYSEEITRLLITSICELIKRIVVTVSELPDLYDTLFQASKKGVSSFWKLLFEDEEGTI